MLLAGAAILSLAATCLHAPDRTNLPIQPQPFAGKVGASPEDSISDWPSAVRAPAGAPNVFLVMTDDVGFAAASTFGGPVPTPNLDRLAERGLRYNQFHTTGICSPSRAALLTGRNHHMVGMGALADMPTGYPGYNGEMPDSAATIADVLRLNGYNTAMFGKHHDVPGWEASAAGPFDHWPTGLGFEYFYGFIGGDSDQWGPHLFRDTTPIEDPPSTPPELLDKRMADDAIRWIHNQNAADPDKPFFIYYAPGTAHAPHQAPKDWIARFHGQFDMGWDTLREQSFTRQKAMGVIPKDAVLTPRPAEIDGWDSLSPAYKRAYARMMEVYAAMLAYQDAQIGRILDEIDRMGMGDNTLVMFIEGDNGGSAEAGNVGMSNEIGRIANRAKDDAAWLTANIDDMGGPKIYENYPAGWAWATNTPFQWTKQVASHLGGTRNGLVVRWPARIKAQNQMRAQFGHVVDVMPTILDAIGVPAPKTVYGVEQQRIDGVSLVPSFANAAERPRTQYFEIYGNRAIYKDGWLANTYPRRMPWKDRPDPGEDGKAYRWELYNLNNDYSQSRNLASKNPGKLKEMQDLFWAEAKRNQVLPIDDRFAVLRSRDSVAAHPRTRSSYTYWGSDVSVMPAAAPSFAGRSFTITADITVPKSSSSGVIAANGSWFGGWTFYLKNGRVVALHAASRRPEDIFRVQSDRAVEPGRHSIVFSLESDGGLYASGTMKISVDGAVAAEGRIGRTIIMTAGLGDGFDVGRDTGVPVTDDYDEPDLPRGAIASVRVDLGPVSARVAPENPSAISK